MGRGPGVRGTSSSSLQIDFKYRGIRCRERIKLAPTEANKKYAKRLKQRIDDEIARGTFNYAEYFPQSKRRFRFAGTATVRLDVAMTAYLDSLERQIQPETLAEYRNDARLVAEHLGNPIVTDITRPSLRALIAGLPLTKKRIRNMLIPLRGTLDQLVEDEKLVANPLHRLKVRRVAAPESDDNIDPFTHAEIAAIASTELGLQWQAWVWMGLRNGEFIALEKRDIDFERGVVRVGRMIRAGRVKVPKTEAGYRNIVMLPGARQALQWLVSGREEGDPVFTNPNTGAGWRDDWPLREAFKRACKAAGVKYRYPNQLRHTYASWALSSGENPAWAAKQMGHKDLIVFFRVYAKWVPSFEPEAGSKMVSKAALRQA